METIRQAQDARLYAECLNGALVVGEYIESIEGEGVKTVKLIESYCEALYKAVPGEADGGALNKQLKKIENSVITDLEPRLEMVFLPYRASMWDSLESIYLAARDDPGCDAYVMPVPFYEKNPGGMLGQMHYDGDIFPQGIPITPWTEYDIDERRPDVVFTHYPYDNYSSNYSIDPLFYSERLRERCELLVYVPYFVTFANHVEEQYGWLPGILFAHKIIVQNETIRHSYISHYQKFNDENGLNERYGRAEDKFIALGSPKFDKVQNTKKEDCPLPCEWEKLIANPDGTRKKIILFNTHMFTWLNNAEQYFKKIRWVFDVFRERGDAVLWWRPHPNTELNFKTQRPELLDEYYAVVDEYRREGFGIYDDTPDLHRAIAWSDAYYGDWSSLVAIYHMTGKPIMIWILSVLPDSANVSPLTPDINSINTLHECRFYESDNINLINYVEHMKTADTEYKTGLENRRKEMALSLNAFNYGTAGRKILGDVVYTMSS